MSKYESLLNKLVDTSTANRSSFFTIVAGINHTIVRFDHDSENPSVLEAVLLRQANEKIKSKEIQVPIREDRIQSLINQLAENCMQQNQEIFITI